jgi:DNA-binding transcriptional LysR family regulator
MASIGSRAPELNDSAEAAAAWTGLGISAGSMCSSAPSLGTWLVPDLIRSFRALEPGVQFVLRQATAENLADMLYQGEVDLAITSPKPRLDEPTDWKVLINERLGLAVPPDHRLADPAPGKPF